MPALGSAPQLLNGRYVPRGSVPFKKKIFFIYLFMRDTEIEAETGKGRSRLPPGSPMQDLIPGPQDYDLTQRQMLNN